MKDKKLINGGREFRLMVKYKNGNNFEEWSRYCFREQAIAAGERVMRQDGHIFESFEVYEVPNFNSDKLGQCLDDLI